MDVSVAQENSSPASSPDARPAGTKEVFVDKETTIPDTRNSPRENPEKSLPSAVTSDKLISTRSSARRPVTRSFSGRPLKRRVREDNALDSSAFSVDDDVPVEAPSPPKKQKTISAPRKRSSRKSAATTSEETLSKDANHITVSAPQIFVPSVAAEPPASVSSSSASTPQPIPPSAPSGPSPHVAGRIGTTRTMRATLPTPVPNLTKKSRGRRVPVRVMTAAGVEVLADPDAGTDLDPVIVEECTEKKDRRSYVCSVEGCGKCFHRGEHLKRHIRSIHTHEKPFKCTYPECDKNFNRHDNLLQHLKVHKQAQATAAMTASGAPVVLLPNGKGKPKSKAAGSGSGKSRNRQRRSSSSNDEDESESESESAASDRDEDERAVSNLLSLRTNPIASPPTLVAPLHHTLTSSYAPTMSSLGSIASAATLVGSEWSYPHSSTFSNSSSAPKPYMSPFPMYETSHVQKPYSLSSIHHFQSLGESLPQSSFSLSKAYSSGHDSFETNRVTHPIDTNGPHTHTHSLNHTGYNSDRMNDMFQSNMSSLRSTSSALRSTNGNDNRSPTNDVSHSGVDNAGTNGNANADTNGNGPEPKSATMTLDSDLDMELTYPSPDLESPTTHLVDAIRSAITNSAKVVKGAISSAADAPDVPSSGVDDEETTTPVSPNSPSVAHRTTLRPVESEMDWKM